MGKGKECLYKVKKLLETKYAKQEIKGMADFYKGQAKRQVGPGKNKACYYAANKLLYIYLYPDTGKTEKVRIALGIKSIDDLCNQNQIEPI